MDTEDVRLAIYEAFTREGQPPTTAALAARIDAPTADVTAALAELAAARHLLLDGDGTVVMAHPFSAVPLGFSMMDARTLWWGGCAWDSFPLPHLLPAEPEVLVATRCPACATTHAWNVSRAPPPTGDQVAHLAAGDAHRTGANEGRPRLGVRLRAGRHGCAP